MTRLLTSLISFYKRFLSPLKPVSSCRYLPTCSSYALEAIEKKGPLLGSGKAFLRVCRCNPLFAGGYDPVERADRKS